MCHFSTFGGNFLKATVVIAAHKPCRLPEDPLYLPVQAGAALHEPFGLTGDNTGDHISEKNGTYCELTVLYWAWKNLDSEYIGLAHYRRHFRGKGRSPLTLEEAEALLAEAPVLLPKKRRYYIESLYSHYAHTLEVGPLEETGRILQEKWPAYYPEFERLKKRTSAHMFNMLVMRRDLLDAYCSWLFDVLAELETRVDTEGMEAFHARFPGRISELLLDVWLNTNGQAYREIPFLYTEKVSFVKKGIGFLKAKFFGKKYGQSF